MRFKTTLAAGIATVAITAGHQAAAVPPSGATCIVSPSSKEPFTEGKEYAAESLAKNWALWAASDGLGMTKVFDEKIAAKQQGETHLHAVGAILEFLGRVRGDDWTPENVSEAAGVLRDLGLDVWQIRSFVGDGKGGKRRIPFLFQVTKALTGEPFLPTPLTENDDRWRDFVTNAINRRLDYFEDREKAAGGYLSGLTGRVQGDVSPFPFLFAYDAKHGQFSYILAAKLMTESLNTPASKAPGASAWHDDMFIGDRATTTDLTDQGRRAFEALPLLMVFYNPNGRVCIKDLATHASFFQQDWPSEDGKGMFEVYRGPDGHYYRMTDNSLVK